MNVADVVAAETISVLSMKCFLTLPCLRRWAHRGDPDPSRTIGLMNVVFSSPLTLSASGVNKHGVFSISRQRPSD